MAMLYCASPGASASTINLETMNITTGIDWDAMVKWWVLPNDLIIQKGFTQGHMKIADGVYRVTFPIAYGGSGWFSVGVAARPASRLSPRFVTMSCAANDESASYFTLCVMNSDRSAAGTEVQWIAIGNAH